jgi:hypothetical protein
MKVFYGMTRDGKHVQANSSISVGEMTPEQRQVLVEVFSTLCEHTTAQNPTPPVPPAIGEYVLVKRGVEDGKCFAEYARRVK